MMMRGVTLFGSKPRTSKGKVTPTPGRATSPAALPAKGAAAPRPAPRTIARSEGGAVPPPACRSSPPSRRAATAGSRQSSPPSYEAPAQPVLRVFPDYEVYEGPKPGRQQQQQGLVQALPPQKQNLTSRASSAPHTPPRKEPVVTLPDGEKGLENNQNEYNCFLNVVIQALWHLPAFRERFMSGAAGHEHHCLGQSCVHCALQTIFLQYQFSEQSIIPPTVLRQALAALYKDESRFQMNQIDDAAEALEAILNRLHHTERAQKEKHADPGQLERKACPCLVHNTFGVRTMDLLRCDTCAATTEPKATGLFVAYAYTYALREARQKAGSENYSFCQFFQKAAQEDRRWCPNADRCNRMCVIEHHLLYLPKVFSVGLVWPSADGAPVKEIEEVMDMITMQIDMSNIFITNTAIGRYLQREKEKQQRASDTASAGAGHQSTTIKDSLLGSGMFDGLVSTTTDAISGDTKERRRRVKCVYELRGMICYYGQHYNSYFRSAATDQWYVFDDVMVNAVGSDWASVKARCLRGHLQPSVLFYEKKEVVEVEDDECCSTAQPEQSDPKPSAPAYDVLLGHAESKAKEIVPVVEPTTSIAAPSLAPPAVDLKRPQPLADGMDALKRTIEAGILEMLLQGEEQWKKEREQERLAASRLVVDQLGITESQSQLQSQPQPQPPSHPEQVHLAVIEEGKECNEEEPHEKPIDREDGHQDENKNEHDSEDDHEAEEVLEEEEEEEKKDDMNGSWFVRRTPESDGTDQADYGKNLDDHNDGAEPLSEEEETEPRNRRLVRRPSLRQSVVTAPPPSDEPEEEDSEWEFVDGNENEVEIIHHDVVCGRSPHRPHEAEAEAEDEGDGLDDGDDGYLGLEEEQDEQEQKRRARSFSNSFTMLEQQQNGADEDVDDEEDKASMSLDGSFTLLDPHDGYHDYVDIEVKRASWIYRRQTWLYRLTAEEMLRIEPATQVCQDSLRYEHMVSIQLYGSAYAAIRYITLMAENAESGVADGVHYVEGDRAAEVALELCRRCPRISLTRHQQG